MRRRTISGLQQVGKSPANVILFNNLNNENANEGDFLRTANNK